MIKLNKNASLIMEIFPENSGPIITLTMLLTAFWDTVPVTSNAITLHTHEIYVGYYICRAENKTPHIKSKAC